MKFIARVIEDSDLYKALVSEDVTAFNYGDNIFELYDYAYICNDVLDLISLQEDPDIIVQAFGRAPSQ